MKGRTDEPHKIKRLEVQFAEDGQMSENSFDVDDLDLERASSSSTVFEDIEAYGEPIGTMFDGYLDSSDYESVTSAKTV